MIKDSNYMKIKELLERYNDEYESIINLSSNIVAINSLNTTYLEVNKKFLDTLEYSKKEVIGYSSLDLNIWLNTKTRQKIISLIKKNGILRDLKINFISKTGKIWQGIMSADIITLENKKIVLSIVEDFIEIKDSKIILKNLLSQERELADIVRKAPMAIAMASPDGEIYSFNQATLNLLDYSEAELSSINWIDLTPKKWHKLEQEKLAEIVTSKSIVKYEKEYIKKDGSIIPVELVVSGIFDKDGRIHKFIGFATDISKRKEIENALNNNLLLKAVGEMASSVAHDFNNSLQIITGNIELLQELPEMTTQIKNYIETIAIAVKDASQRVKSLQTLGNKKEIKRKFQLISIEELLNEVVAQTRPLWKNKKEKEGLSIVVETFYGKGLNIVGNLGELRTVFYNIMINSIEAMINNGKIQIYTQKIKNNIVIEVKDSGIGMSKETIKNIFQPFYSTKDFGVGRGLGMSGAFNIIKEHNGNIKVKSKLGEGASFLVTLPHNEFEFQFEEEEFVEKYLKKLKVLWVDDEVMIQKLGKKVLSRLGHKAYIASDGLEALSIITNSTTPFELLITDIGMPNMNGWQLVEEVRKRFNTEMKIIVLTGWGGEISTEKQKIYDIDEILEKPINIEDLKNSISRVMNKNHN